MRKGVKENKNFKSTPKQAIKEENSINKQIIVLNKKIVIPISILIILILLATLIVYAFTGKQKNTELQAIKTSVNAINLVNNEYMHVEEDASGDKVTVPNGNVGSSVTGENEIDTGYVIYEGEEAVTDSNVAEAQKSRNQYVWVPVPDISKFYGTDSNGKKWGKLYSFTTELGDEIDEITGTYPRNWKEVDGKFEITYEYHTFPYIEPYVAHTDTDSKIKGISNGGKHEFLNQNEKEFNSMLASVEKYGGFYIGRYETGNISQDTPVIRKGNTNINYQTWYEMYKRCKNIKGKNTNVETGMIWGNQWDRTLMWLIETGNKTKVEIADDSTSWGNYYNATFEYVNSSGSTATKNENSETIIPTGSTEYTKANNIYDLAGNVFDYTMQINEDIRTEVYTSSIRVAMGGSYINSGNEAQASQKGTAPPDYSRDIIGCRAMLYIKVIKT